METKSFTYRYSAERNREVARIREKYIPREENKLALLKRLDLRVQMAGVLEALCLGIVGALVFGIGMCFALDVFAGGDWLTVLFMALGALLMVPAYPVCQRVAAKRRAELTPEILRLSEELMRS